MRQGQIAELISAKPKNRRRILEEAAGISGLYQRRHEAELKLAANGMGIRKLELGEHGGRIVFEAKPKIDPMAVIQLIQKQPRLYAMDGPDKLRIKVPLPDAPDRFNAAKALLMTLALG